MNNIKTRTFNIFKVIYTLFNYAFLSERFGNKAFFKSKINFVVVVVALFEMVDDIFFLLP